MYTRNIGGRVFTQTPVGLADLHVHRVGPHPILNHFLDRMGFHRIITSCLGSDRISRLDHAHTLAVLIQNIILSPAPLYRIADWADPIDPAALGITAGEKRALNDDRVGRSLDALVSTRGRNVFFLLALHIIKAFELDTQRIHHDTTTITFYGNYASSIQEPCITHGHNKDHRPDLKQLVFGLNVTADGAVPLSHQVFSGNRTDDTIHCNNVDHLRQVLGREDFVYVADSKLCTRKNLKHIADYGGGFVTVMPRSRSEDKLFRKQIRENTKCVRWRKTASLPNPRGGEHLDTYWTTTDGSSRTEDGYRLIWCRSSQKMEADAQWREGAMTKAEVELHDLGGRLNRGKLKKRSHIQKRVNAIQKEHGCSELLTVLLTSRSILSTKRIRRGRPGKNDPMREVRSKRYALSVQRNKEAIRAHARADGVFPIVTNLKEKRYSKKEVLLVYKYQPYVERRHHLFKSELEVAPAYVKKPRRAAGLIHATFLAMTLDALIERTVRQEMARRGIGQIPILPESRMTKTPTTARLLEMFSGVSWYTFQRGEETVVFPMKLTPIQKLLLGLLRMDVSAYA